MYFCSCVFDSPPAAGFWLPFQLQFQLQPWLRLRLRLLRPKAQNHWVSRPPRSANMAMTAIKCHLLLWQRLNWRRLRLDQGRIGDVRSSHSPRNSRKQVKKLGSNVPTMEYPVITLYNATCCGNR